MAFPSTTVLDNFNRANGAVGSNWGPYWGGASGDLFTISSNQITGTTKWMAWTASTFGPDLEVYFTVITNPGDIWLDFRLTSISSPNGYSVEITGSTWKIIRDDGGGTTQLGATFSQAVSSGDKVGASIVGSTITAYYKASAGSWTSLATRTDATYSTAGNIALQGNSGTGTFDDFGGGTVVTGGTNVNVSVNSLSLSMTPQTTTVRGDANVSLNSTALSMAAQSVTVRGDANVAVNALSMSMAAQAVTVSITGDVNVNVNALSMTMAPQNVSVSTGSNVSVNALSLSLAPQAVAVSIDQNVAVNSLSMGLGIQPVSVTTTSNVNVALNALSLTMTPLAVAVNSVTIMGGGLSGLSGLSGLGSTH